MSDDMKMVQAEKVFATLTAYLDSNNWAYEKKEDVLGIAYDFKGEDIGITFSVHINAEYEQIQIFSLMPYPIRKEKCNDMLLATCFATTKSWIGLFFVDDDGDVEYYSSTSYTDSVISESTFSYLLSGAEFDVDRFNDKFLLLNNDIIDFEKFVELSDNGN